MDELTRSAVATLAAPTFVEAPACDCGATLAPDGACMEIGACERADTLATRGAGGPRSKSDPSSWTVRGSVD